MYDNTHLPMKLQTLLTHPLAVKTGELCKAFFHPKGRRTRLLTAFVYIPTAIIGLYLWLIFTPMYISESYFALRTNDGSGMDSLPGLLFQAAGSTVMDAFILQNYITSYDMLDKVSSRIDLREHYGASSRDIISRLKSSPTREEMLDYWQWLVSVSYEQDKGILAVEVKAYTPEMAKAINDAIIHFSEALVNQMNDRAHQDAIRLAQDEVQGAEKRVLEAQASLRKFRDDKSMLDPEQTAKMLSGVIATLESESATVQAELNASLEVMSKNSPRVQTLQTRLRAIREQLEREKNRLAGLSVHKSTLSALVGDYSQLITEEKFAQERLVRAMAALEGARLKAIAKSRYIVPFQPPTLPEESMFPRPFLFTAFAFLLLLVLLGICSLIVAAIKDHMGV
jgi:capsular polysaccharide transport system permease protein